jgi:hypothetical protein
MSLVQHVTAVEGPDLVPEDDIASLQLGRRLSHTLSYDPIPLQSAAPEKLDPVGAYKVSAALRLAQVAVGVLTCVLASGIVFGFAALKSVLVVEDVYGDLCSKEEVEDYVELCYHQDRKYALRSRCGSAC